MFSIKTVALAGAVLLATVGGSFAATIDGNTPVKDGPAKWANTVQWAQDGEHVTVLQCQNGYCLVKINGPDGWVKKADIDFNNWNGPKKPWKYGYGYPYGYGGPVGCVYGPYGYVCI